MNQINDEEHQSHNQKEMNESSECVRGDHPEKPEDTQNDENRPKHAVPISQESRVESACVAPGEGFGDFLEDPIVDKS